MSTRLTLEQVKDTQEYSVLTGKQQLFVDTYIKSGLETKAYDPIFATLAAYNCKSKENARVMSYALMMNIRIVAVLNRHFNREPIEAFLIQIDNAIRNKKLTIAQLSALKLKGDILGYTSRLPGTSGLPTGVIPPDVIEADKAARKAKRKKPEKAERTPKAEPPSDFDNRWK